MRRVLIVTSSYAPTMIADMHRARHLAWELPKLGWEVEILSPGTSYQTPSYIDDDSAVFFSPETPTHFAPEFCRFLFQIFGSKGIGWRAIIPMMRAGQKLLKERNFDIVYISTAKFPLFLLGPAWRSLFGVPFILDFHDPCYKEEISNPVWTRPSLKHFLANWLSKHVEARATPAAAGLVSVSPIYINILRRRYEGQKPAWLHADRQVVIPFAALSRDLDEVAEGIGFREAAAEHTARIIYVGAGGPIMLHSFSLLCKALSNLRVQHPELVGRVRIELYGTMLGWREGDPRHLADLARERGVADLVIEHPGRVSYRRSLELLLESDGALILGVDDAGYMPSKLFTYALSGKPLLASLRQDGPSFAQFQNNPELGHALWFRQSEEIPVSEAVKIVSAFLHEVTERRTFDRRASLERFLAPAMARQHVKLFETCLHCAS